MRLARLSILFLGIAITGCATDTSDPQTSEVESAVISKWSEHWNEKTPDGTDIWPATTGNGTPITNTYVLIKNAPPDPTTGNPRLFGFVVWNTNVVGHIYLINQGSAGANFREHYGAVGANRTNGQPSFAFGSAGNPDVDPVPIPRPHIDNEYGFTATELANVKSNAQAINNATVNFMNYTE